MGRRTPSLAAALVLTLSVACQTGCVDRHFVVESAPPGAVVIVNDIRVGEAPVDVPFTYYGKYRFVFVADGYERLTLDENVKSPWWSYFPLDFVVENLLPFTIRDIRTIQKPLEPMRVYSAEEIRQRGEILRARGQTIGQPLAATNATAPLVCPPGTQPVQPANGYIYPTSQSDLPPASNAQPVPVHPANLPGTPGTLP